MFLAFQFVADSANTHLKTSRMVSSMYFPDSFQISLLVTVSNKLFFLCHSVILFYTPLLQFCTGSSFWGNLSFLRFISVASASLSLLTSVLLQYRHSFSWLCFRFLRVPSVSDFYFSVMLQSLIPLYGSSVF